MSGTVPNHGFMLHENGNGNAYFKKLYSKGEGGPNVPTLVVGYTRPTATLTSPTGGTHVYSRGLSWSFDDNCTCSPARGQTGYRVQLSTDDLATTPYLHDSLATPGSGTTYSVPGTVTLVHGTTYHWRVRLQDGVGWSDWATGSFVWDTTLLAADIVSPLDNGGAAATTTITGTAAGAGFTDYTLKYQAGCTPGGTLIDIGTNPRTTAVSNGTLATWDTTALTVGAYYRVELTVAATPSPLTDAICVLIDRTAPTATLSVPLTLDGLVDITGTATDTNLVSYALEYAPGAGATTGFAPVDPSAALYTTAVATTGLLGSWDRQPSGAPLQGAYTVRLTVTDIAGNATVTHDALDRLREITRSGTTHRARYLGTSTQRIQWRNVTSGTNGRRIAWDRTTGTMLADYNGVDSGIRYYGTNGHRDTAWTADATGAVTATVRYDPWGGILASSGSIPEWRFQGSWHDVDADLTWVVTRWYAPTLGRFISEDTLLGEPRDPMSRHLYAYAEGDPVGGWDPDGRIAFSFDGTEPSIRCHDRVKGSNYADLTSGAMAVGAGTSDIGVCSGRFRSSAKKLPPSFRGVRLILKVSVGGFWKYSDTIIAGGATWESGLQVSVHDIASHRDVRNKEYSTTPKRTCSGSLKYAVICDSVLGRYADVGITSTRP